jgi:hypothetical protein
LARLPPVPLAMITTTGGISGWRPRIGCRQSLRTPESGWRPGLLCDNCYADLSPDLTVSVTYLFFSLSASTTADANPLAVDIFAADLLAAALATQLTFIYGNRKNLLTDEFSPWVLASLVVRA